VNPQKCPGKLLALLSSCAYISCGYSVSQSDEACCTSEGEWLDSFVTVKNKSIRVLQTLRVGSFEDLTVLGSQYCDHTGVSHWYVAVLSEQDVRVRIYRLPGGELPDHVDSADREALLEAIDMWEQTPASQPN
jgi:hypothetical protein